MIEMHDPTTAEYVLHGIIILWDFTYENPVIVIITALWLYLVIFCVEYRCKSRNLPEWYNE